MTERKKVFISGPYTYPDTVENTRNAVLMATELLKAGYSPYIPHLTHFWHFLTPMPYETWLEHDQVWLEVCDAVIRIEGFSPGADKEVQEAMELQIPVAYSLEELQKRFPVEDE